MCHSFSFDPEDPCAKTDRIQQKLTLPNGNDVVVDPGTTKVDGPYHVSNGRSTLVTRLQQRSPSQSCADVGRGSNQITVVLSSFEE